nr:MAG TPA: hypothetical protein [Caudoviricetes sp.]
MLTPSRKRSVFNGFTVLCSGFDSRIPLQIKKTSNPLRLLVFLCLSMLRGAFGNLCGAKNVADLRLFFA